MELNNLFKIQDIMENKIKKMSSISEDSIGEENLFDVKFLALQTKLGELANLTKCYKYSMIDYEIPKEKLIIRYMDTLKFLLSIGNNYNFNIIDNTVIDSINHEESLIKLFSNIFDNISSLKSALKQDNFIDGINLYIKIFSDFVSVGEILGLSFDELYDTYLKCSFF